MAKNDSAKHDAGKHDATSDEPRRYDVAMIRDFFDQLRLEVQIRLLENSGDDGREYRNLLKQLRRFTEKYNAGLLLAWELQPDGCTSQEYADALSRVRQALVDGRRKQLEQLDAVQDVLREALRCALHPLSDGPLVARHRASDVLKKRATESQS